MLYPMLTYHGHRLNKVYMYYNHNNCHCHQLLLLFANIICDSDDPVLTMKKELHEITLSYIYLQGVLHACKFGWVHACILIECAHMYS